MSAIAHLEWRKIYDKTVTYMNGLPLILVDSVTLTLIKRMVKRKITNPVFVKRAAPRIWFSPGSMSFILDKK